MAKNWKKFIPPSVGDVTQEQPESLNRNLDGNGDLHQQLNALGLDNAEWKALMQEREQLEQTMKGLTQADKEANATNKRYDQLIPSFKEKKEAEKKWLMSRADLYEKRRQQKLLDKIKAKTTFSEAKKQIAKTDDEAPRSLKFKDSEELKNKDGDRLRNPKALPDLKLAELKLPDSDTIKAKWLARKKEERLMNAKSKHKIKDAEAKLDNAEDLKSKIIEKKKELNDLFNKDNRSKAIEALKVAKRKLENAKDTVKRVNEYTSKAKEETKKIEKKLSEVGNFYKKLDEAAKKSNNPELSKELEKINERIGSDKLQDLKKLRNKSEELKNKIVNPINDEWEKLNNKRRELVSKKEKFVKKAKEFLSADLSSLPDLQERADKLKKLLEARREEEKSRKKEEEKSKTPLLKRLTDKKEDNKEDTLEEKRKSRQEGKMEEKRSEKKREEERERKREERKSKRNNNN